MTKGLLETENLIVGYGKKRIVEGVNLSAFSGEIVSLIGPNGAGKSTILKTIAGQISPIAGSINILGQDIKSMAASELAKSVAVLFTGESVRDVISCFEVVSMGRYPYTGFLGRLSKEDIDKTYEAMELTNISELKGSDFTKISDGQRQRVLLARALCQEPKILILDEPTTFLDVKYRLEFLGLLKKISKEKGFAVIMSLHELDMARQISDKIMCIKDTKVIKVGTSEEIFAPGFINYLFDITVGNYDEESFRALL